MCCISNVTLVQYHGECVFLLHIDMDMVEARLCVNIHFISLWQ